MAHVRFADLQSRPTEFLDFTSLTLDEFQQLVQPFEAAFQAHMAAWCLDGKPRTARRFSVYQNCPLSTPEDRLLFILAYVKTYSLQVVQGRLFGMGQSKANQWIHVLLPALLGALRTLGDAPTRSLGALAQRLGVSETDVATVVAPLEEASAPAVAGPAAVPASPLFAHDGTERRIVRPQDPPKQAACYSGKKKDHTVKNVLLVNALLMILFLSDTYGGRVHDKPIADATPYPLPAGSRLLQDLGFLAFTLPQVEILMPTKKPRGEELPLAQQLANQALHHRRLRIEHVNSSVKRCRIVKDRIRLWKEGVRDLVMEICCALHNFCIRLTPWQPMV
jgi:hypothetical protein